MIEDQEFYWELLDTLKDGVYFVNAERKVTYWNKAAGEITGYKSPEVLGKFCGDNILIHIDNKGNNLCHGVCPLAGVLKTGKPTEVDIYLHHKNGYRVPVHVRVNPVKNKEEDIIGAVEIFSDRSQREIVGQRMQELKEMDLLDSLTGLPNRRFLEMSLNTRLTELRQYNRPFGILYFYIKAKESKAGPKAFDKAIEIISKSFINTCNLFDVIGRWENEKFIGIFSNVNPKKLKTLDEFYRVILEKTDLSSTGISPILETGAALAEPGDKPENVIEKAKQKCKALKYTSQVIQPM
jgi:PAS domain S-box-containing protein